MQGFSFTRGHIHCWQGTEVMCSNEQRKRLYAFKTWGDCVNFLFTSGHRETARALNAALNAAREKADV